LRGHRRTSSTALLLIMIFFFAFLALTCAPYNYGLLSKIPRVHVDEALMLPAFSIFGGGLNGFNEASTLLNQTTRMDIYNFIIDNPGLHFRALSDYLSLPIGVLQYHLGLLVNGGLLSTHQDGRYKRYFESKRFTETEMKVISVLRNGTSGKILVALFEKPQVMHKELALQLNISSQALSWQMHRLEKMGLVKRNVVGLNVKYSLDETIYTTVSQYNMLMGMIPSLRTL
jgi:predicted transcriptional regulator